MGPCGLERKLVSVGLGSIATAAQLAAVVRHQKSSCTKNPGRLFHSNAYFVKGRSSHHLRRNTGDCSIIWNRIPRVLDPIEQPSTRLTKR